MNSGWEYFAYVVKYIEGVHAHVGNNIWNHMFRAHTT